ncbi:MAG: hypothetical protein HY902_13180, partial [Deltaproteobacteria bacterium]|nr:hypothetical protein [Deltaproteobacteria bacterium]
AAEQDLDCDGAPDPWFSNPWDAYWFNGTPQWGSADAAVKDDPTLDLDDTDGAGPENLNLVAPEGDAADPVAYPVGVHYWNDHGYGTSLATVAIWVQGSLVVQLPKVPLAPLDMWYVGKLWWPNSATGGTKEVFETCHQAGSSCKAGTNLMWQPVGDYCITKCYANETFIGTLGGGAVSATCNP